MKVLVLCTQSPLPARAGAPIRTWGWLRTASQRAELGLVTLIRSPEEHAALGQLRSICSWVTGVAAPRTPFRKAFDFALSSLTATPYLLRAAMEARMKAAVQRALEQWKPDIVQAECIGATVYLDLARARGLPCIYSAHNVESRIVNRPDRNKEPWRRITSRGMKPREIKVARQATAVVTVSAEEEGWFRQYAGKVCRIPNAVFADEYPFSPPSSKTRNTIVFIGHLGYPPNRDAARIVAKEVFPRIRKAVPDVICIIAGRTPGKEILQLGGNAVQILGDVENMNEVWKQAGVFVCPLRWGAGSRLKLLEAAAVGVPIVASGFSAEGLALAAGRDCLQAETVEDMARQAIGLLKDFEQADRLAQNARRTVEKHHNWPLYREQITTFYEDLAHYHG